MGSGLILRPRFLGNAGHARIIVEDCADEETCFFTKCARCAQKAQIRWDPLLRRAPLPLTQSRVKRLRGQPMQHQPEAGRQRRKWDHRVFVVQQTEMMRFIENARDVKRHSLVELQGIRRAPEVVVGQEELIERSVYFNRRLHVNQVRPSARKFTQRERRVCNAIEVDLLGRLDLDSALAQLAVQLDDEVEEIEIVFEEEIIEQVVKTFWSELM